MASNNVLITERFDGNKKKEAFDYAKKVNGKVYRQEFITLRGQNITSYIVKSAVKGETANVPGLASLFNF
jgi:hypothetical protein